MSWWLLSYFTSISVKSERETVQFNFCCVPKKVEFLGSLCGTLCVTAIFSCVSQKFLCEFLGGILKKMTHVFCTCENSDAFFVVLSNQLEESLYFSFGKMFPHGESKCFQRWSVVFDENFHVLLQWQCWNVLEQFVSYRKRSCTLFLCEQVKWWVAEILHLQYGQYILMCMCSEVSFFKYQ